MAYCYQCSKCVIDYDVPPEDHDCWCTKNLKGIDYKDEVCDKFEWNKLIKKGSKDHPEYKFNELYGKYINHYFRYKSEPEIIYQLLNCFDSFMIYKVESPKYCLPRIFIYNKLFSIPEGEQLETSFDKEEWFNYEDLDRDMEVVNES